MTRGKISIKRSLLATVISLLLAPLLIYSGLCLIRPSRTNLPKQQLFQG
ncbi:hypothetical protein [Chroococcidiopsis sp. CCMEE 29]|nr:hypothetical protein [Chroococcidiopsis sp. CCMEE 29]